MAKVNYQDFYSYSFEIEKQPTAYRAGAAVREFISATYQTIKGSLLRIAKPSKLEKKQNENI